MNYDVLLHPDEPRYWVMLLSTLLGGWLLVRAFDRVLPENRDKARRTLGWALVVGNVLLPLYAVIHPDQEFSIHRSLPLHFCGLNYLLIAINCFAMNRTVYTLSLIHI